MVVILNVTLRQTQDGVGSVEIIAKSPLPGSGASKTAGNTLARKRALAQAGIYDSGQ